MNSNYGINQNCISSNPEIAKIIKNYNETNFDNYKLTEEDDISGQNLSSSGVVAIN